MAVIQTKLSEVDLEILNTLDEDEGSSASWLAEELGLSESTISTHITKLRALQLISRHRDEDGDLLIYKTQKGRGVLEKTESGRNPKEVGKMAKFTVQVDDPDLVDDIKELAQSEGKSVSEFLSDLTGDAIDEFYPESEEEEEEEET